MSHDLASAKTDREDLRNAGQARRATSPHEAPSLAAARTHLRQLAQDLGKNRQFMAVLARELRATEPAPPSGFLCPNNQVLTVEEWVADCADLVAHGLADLEQLAEVFAQADWYRDVVDWLDGPFAASGSQAS